MPQPPHDAMLARNSNGDSSPRSSLTLISALRLTGGAPDGSDDSSSRLPSDCIFNWLIDTWSRHAADAPTARQRRCRRMLACLKAVDTQNASIALSPPTGDATLAEAWLGQRLYWSCQRLPAGPCRAIVSSRIGRRAPVQDVWLQAVRQLCGAGEQPGQVLLTSEQTIAERVVLRCGQLFGQPVIRLRVADSTAALNSWFESVLRISTELGSGNALGPIDVFVSPPLSPALASSLQSVPDRDCALIALADKVSVVALRRTGHYERLIRARLHARHPADGAVELVTHSSLIAPRTLEDLRSLGASTVSQRVNSSSHNSAPPTVIMGASLQAPANRIDRNANAVDDQAAFCIEPVDSAYLTHWTRAATSESLGSLDDDFLDEVLLSGTTGDRSAFGILARILRTGQLLGTATAIRGRTPVVCFSELPLRRLLQMRNFRAHRTRWDCEPYGLCIRRDVLEKLGARPVVYGGDDLYSVMPKASRLWFQKRYSQTKSTTIDWSVEQEWRLPGNLDLNLVPANAAIVFVRQCHEVELLSQFSAWPVMAVGSQTASASAD